MSELLNLNIKDELDKIDDGMMNAVVDGFYNSKVKIYTGMWEKGRIVSVYRGVNADISFRELQKITGRNNEDLKRWHTLFMSYPEKKKFIENYAKPKALAWAQKAIPVKTITETEEETLQPTLVEKLFNAFSKLSDEEKTEFVQMIQNG